MEVLPATPGHFEEIYPLLLDFGAAHMTREDWRRMIFDLPWPVEEPHRGYMLRDGGAVVGFLGTIFSSRMIGGRRRRFCATSSWIVRESHRSASLQLVRPLLELTSHTILNPAPSPTAFEIFRRLGLRPLDDTQILVPPFARLDQATRWIGDRVTTDLGAMRSELDAEGRAIVDHMAGTRAAQAMLRSGRRRCHIVATRSPWKGPLRLAHVVYASDWELLWLDPGLACAALFRRIGTLGLRVDGRHLVGRRPGISVQKAIAPPRLYRPAEPDLTPQMIDGLYTEFVGEHW